jgi:lysophospholipase L1-like esterase
MSGTNSNQWALWIDQLLPTDTDLFIFTIGTNDRSNTGSNFSECRQTIFNNLSIINDYCKANNITMLLVSPNPTSATNESSPSYVIHNWDISEIQREWAQANNVNFFNLYNKVYEYYFQNGEDIGSYADGLHPDDDMYYVLFYTYCFLLDVQPNVPKLTNP